MVRKWSCEIRPPLMNRGSSSWSRRVILLLQQASTWPTMLSIPHCLYKITSQTLFRPTEPLWPFRVDKEVLLVDLRDTMISSLSSTPIRAGRSSLLNGNLTTRLPSGRKRATFISVDQITKRIDWHWFKNAKRTSCSKSNQGRMGLLVSKIIRAITSEIKIKH